MAFNVDESVYTQMAQMCNQVDIGARQVDHLKIRAPQSGRIIERELKHLLGTFLDTGNEIALIGSTANTMDADDSCTTSG